MTNRTLHSLFGQKAWANAELFQLLSTLPTEQNSAILHSAIRTLNHIYVVDRIFQAHLEGQPHGYAFTNTEDTPLLDELGFSVAETDAWFKNYAETISESALQKLIHFKFTDGDSGTMTCEEILLHVITHGAYHRGNVGQLLKSISVAPPRDLYTKFLHVSEPSRRQAPSVTTL